MKNQWTLGGLHDKRTTGVYVAMPLGTLRYGLYWLQTTSGRESTSTMWTEATTLKECENQTLV